MVKLHPHGWSEPVQLNNISAHKTANLVINVGKELPHIKDYIVQREFKVSQQIAVGQRIDTAGSCGSKIHRDSIRLVMFQGA
jgi:hypothetical protein